VSTEGRLHCGKVFRQRSFEQGEGAASLLGWQEDRVSDRRGDSDENAAMSCRAAA